MKKLFLLLVAVGTLVLIFGCSQSPPTKDVDQPEMVMTPRPEFIETRPAAEVQAHIMIAEEMSAFEKKPPPQPPPDTGDPNPNPAHKYAYIVGISDYEGTANDLLYADDDAMDIKNLLQGEGFTIQMDLNQNATAENIEAGLMWLVSQAQPGDEIAFYYSGHGAKAPGYGSSIISTDLYYVTHGFVMYYFNAVDCSKKLLAMDACVLGDFHSDVVSGTMGATASTNTNSYDVPAFQHGAYTYFFLEAADDLNYIYAEDVATYAEDEMKAWARQYHVRVSPKHTDKYDGLFDM